MSDVGYSTEYEIYLTQENGVQIVTNDLSLTILREMRYHEISPTDIAMELNLSKSTVQASITKLLRMGIVSQEPCINDARSVVYHISATLLFCSDTDIEWQIYARMASTIRILKSGRCTSREDLALYGVSLTESGLNVVQGLFNVGAALTATETDRDYWKAMMSSVESQCIAQGIRCDFKMDNGIELNFDSPDENISDITMVVVPMLGAMISHSREIMGKNLTHDVSLSVSRNGRSVKMRVDPYVGQDFEEKMTVSNNIDHYRIEEPFSIYSINGKSTLFTNATMMGILYNLSNADCSVNDLEDLMGISKATIYVSIMKLVEMGAIEIDKNSGSPKNYRLLADPILYCTEPEAKDCKRLHKIMEKFQNGNMDYYSAVISFAMEAFRCMGIHFDKMFIRSGKSTARCVLELCPDIEPQHLMDVACSMVSTPDTAEIVTLLPIKVRVTLAKDTLWETWPGDFVKGFVQEGLKQLTGDNYRITIETVREGDDRPLKLTNNY